MIKKATVSIVDDMIKTVAVSWDAEGQPLKWQSHIFLRDVHVYGFPCTTPDFARQSLFNALNRVKEDVLQVIELKSICN